jgi:hypothetical protein
MYPAANGLLLHGRSYTDFLHFLAANGYYGEAASMRWSQSGSTVCAIPADQSFEDTLPDGRVFGSFGGGWRRAAL